MREAERARDWSWRVRRVGKRDKGERRRRELRVLMWALQRRARSGKWVR